MSQVQVVNTHKIEKDMMYYKSLQWKREYIGWSTLLYTITLHPLTTEGPAIEFDATVMRLPSRKKSMLDRLSHDQWS